MAPVSPECGVLALRVLQHGGNTALAAVGAQYSASTALLFTIAAGGGPYWCLN